MDCVILAGGRGKRLNPITEEIPKPLIEVNDKKLIEYLLEIVYSRFDKIIIVIDYLGGLIYHYLINSAYADKIIFVKQNPKIKGTMGALISAKDLIETDFLVICSDNIFNCDDIDKLIEKPNSFLIINVTPEEKDNKYKDAKFSLIKHSNLNYLEAGAWYLSKDFINKEPVLVNGSNEFGIPHTIFLDYKINPSKYNIVYTADWLPVGTFWELNKAKDVLKTGAKKG